jgi:hypothetical protein
VKPCVDPTSTAFRPQVRERLASKRLDHRTM